jgi:hypothetical protein
MPRNHQRKDCKDGVEGERLREKCAAVFREADARRAEDRYRARHAGIFVIGAMLVTVLIDGLPVEGSTPARICDDVVMAPLEPYLRDVADRIQVDDLRGIILVERAGRSISIAIGSSVLRSGATSSDLPIAPYLRAGEPVIPLAAIARALGARVEFDAASKTISIAWEPQPLVSATPDASYTPPLGPLDTFTPQPTPAPKVVVTGVPKPRRTPVVVQEGQE